MFVIDKKTRTILIDKMKIFSLQNGVAYATPFVSLDKKTKTSIYL